MMSTNLKSDEKTKQEDKEKESLILHWRVIRVTLVQRNITTIRSSSSSLAVYERTCGGPTTDYPTRP